MTYLRWVLLFYFEIKANWQYQLVVNHPAKFRMDSSGSSRWPMHRDPGFYNVRSKKAGKNSDDCKGFHRHRQGNGRAEYWKSFLLQT